MSNTRLSGNGLTSLPLGDLGLVETWRPRRIGIAGVRFQSGGDDAKAAADKAAADAKAKADADAAAAADKGKTPEQIAADKKAADDAAAKTAADEQAAKDAAAKKGESKDPAETQGKAPDKYELAIPEAAKAAIGGDLVRDLQADVEEVAKANGWSNEDAQAELDLRLVKANDRLTALRTNWLKDLTADPTYGGAKLEETQQLARKAVNALRPDGHPRRESFLRLLNGSGMGNHVEVVSLLADLGRLMKEDSPNLGKTGEKETARKPDSQVLFPSSAKA